MTPGRVLLLATLAFALASATATAQETAPGPPVPLVTPQPPAASPPVMATAPPPMPAQPDLETPTAAPVPATPAAPGAATSGAPPAGIEAKPLGPVDPNWANALPQGEQPLPPGMWQDSSRTMVRAVLPLLAPSPSPGITALTRRLLLSGATAPAGGDPPDGPSLLLLRAETLAALGMVDGGIAVLDLVPAGQRAEPMQRLRVELAFAGNDITGACARVGAAIMSYRDVWWDRAQIACQLLAGDRDKAAAALEILHDRDEAPDPLFDSLMAAAEGHAVRLTKATRLTPLGATLWAASKRPLPLAIVAAADPATLCAFAGDPAEPAVNRLAAAERATALGAWAPERLAKLYRAALPGAARTPPADPRFGATPRERALLYTAAATLADPMARAAALHRFLAAAAAHDLFFVASRLAAPIILALKPDDQLKGDATLFIRALVAANRPQAIEAWLPIADPTEIGPFATVVHAIEGGRAMPDAKAVAQAVATLARRKSKAGPRQVSMFEMLAAAFGTNLTPDELAAEVAPAHPGALPSLALWLAQRDAAVAYRQGGIVLTSLAIAASGHVLAEPILLARILAGLRAAGLVPDEQRIALEAAVADGI